MPDKRPYGLHEAEGFLDKAVEVVGDLWEWEEIKAALDFALSRDPNSFQRIGDSDIFAVQLATFVPHAVYFSVDDEAEQVRYEDIF